MTDKHIFKRKHFPFAAFLCLSGSLEKVHFIFSIYELPRPPPATGKLLIKWHRRKRKQSPVWVLYIRFVQFMALLNKSLMYRDKSKAANCVHSLSIIENNELVFVSVHFYFFLFRSNFVIF